MAITCPLPLRWYFIFPLACPPSPETCIPCVRQTSTTTLSPDFVSRNDRRIPSSLCLCLAISWGLPSASENHDRALRSLNFTFLSFSAPSFHNLIPGTLRTVDRQPGTFPASTQSALPPPTDQIRLGADKSPGIPGLAPDNPAEELGGAGPVAMIEPPVPHTVRDRVERKLPFQI